MMMESTLEAQVQRAVAGDKEALETVVMVVQDQLYNLALRMLWHPEEARDATQEILIKIVTRLSSFRGESAFTTWCYRVATNYLLNVKQKAFAQPLPFSAFAERLAEGLSEVADSGNYEADQALLVQEAKVGCSHAMLQCLARESRLVYILGEILEFSSPEGAAILGQSADNFRQKLSRARASVHAFLHGNCGLVNPTNPCRCHKKVKPAMAQGLIDPDHLLFATEGAPMVLIGEIEATERAVALYRSNPQYQAPGVLVEAIKELLSGPKD